MNLDFQCQKHKNLLVWLLHLPRDRWIAFLWLFGKLNWKIYITWLSCISYQRLLPYCSAEAELRPMCKVCRIGSDKLANHENFTDKYISNLPIYVSMSLRNFLSKRMEFLWNSLEIFYWPLKHYPSSIFP